MKKTLYYNAKVFTSDQENPEVDAFIVSDGKFEWAGNISEKFSGTMGKEEFDEMEKTDLEGKRVLPGFVDSHMHAVMLADCCKQIAALPPEIFSIEELVAEVRRRRTLIRPSETVYSKEDFLSKRSLWIEGWGFDE